MKTKTAATNPQPTKPPARRVTCRHCKARREHVATGRVFPNGNRAMICSECGRPFVDQASGGA